MCGRCSRPARQAISTPLDRLSALERAAFLLHDVFDCSFSEVARALYRSEAACRQLASRARAHVREARPQGTSTIRDRSEVSNHQQLVSAFVNAARSGDLQTLMGLLADDVRLMTDGGGKVPAALNVIEGPDRTARFIVGAVSKGLPEGSIVRLTGDQRAAWSHCLRTGWFGPKRGVRNR